MLQAEHGIKIFSDGPLRSISRANRLATLERWNLPQVCHFGCIFVHR